MPNRFTPINSNQSTKTALQIANKNFMALDAETFTKTIQNNGTNQMESGRLSNGRYGEIFYDASGMPRILIGQAPGNGRPGIWITKAGFDVLKEVG